MLSTCWYTDFFRGKNNPFELTYTTHVMSKNYYSDYSRVAYCLENNNKKKKKKKYRKLSEFSCANVEREFYVEHAPDSWEGL